MEHDYLPAFMSYYDRFDGYGFWAAIDKSNDEFLGWFHLRPQEGDPIDQPELGYRLRREAWGMGYGTEGARALIRKGFTDLGAERVVATAFRDNLASRRVMEKSGMTLARAVPPDTRPVGGDARDHLPRACRRRGRRVRDNKDRVGSADPLTIYLVDRVHQPKANR